MASTASIIALIALVLLAALKRAPQDGAGSRPLLSAYNVVLGAFFVYALFPAYLILQNAGQFVWAPGYEANNGHARALVLVLVALLSFLYGNLVAGSLRRARKRSGISGLPPNTSETPGTPRLIAGQREPDYGHSPVMLVRRPSMPASMPGISGRSLAFLLLALGMLLKLYVIFSLGGAEATLARLSSGARDRLTLETASSLLIGLRTLSAIADVAAVWLVLDALRTRRRLVTSSGIFFLVTTVSFLSSGKRLTLLLPLLVILCGIHAYRRKLNISAAPWVVAAVAIIGMSTLLLRVFLPASVANINIELQNVPYARGSVVQFYFYSLEFATVEMIAVSMQSGEPIVELFGGRSAAFVTTNLTPFTYAIPRAVFPPKPSVYYDLSYGVSSAVQGVGLADTTTGFASTLIGTSYIIGSGFGTVAAFLIVGFVVRMYDSYAVRGRVTFTSLVRHALVLTVAFQLFRQGTLGWTFIVAIFQNFGFILGALALSRGCASRSSASASASAGRSGQLQRSEYSP